MLTPLGRQIRRLRLDKGVRLKDMADAFGVKSSFLSAIENGRKSVPDKLLLEIHRYFDGFGVSLEQWQDLAERSKDRLTIDMSSADETDREAMVAFGRYYLDLPPARKRKIREMLKK